MVRKKTEKIRHYLLPALASVLLSVGIGHTVADRFYPVSTVDGGTGEEARTQSRAQPGAQPLRTRGDRSPGPASDPASDPEGAADISRSLAKLHLFGEMPTQAAAAPPLGEEAPETTLQLALRGVISAVGEEESFAIIADAKGRQDHYAAGDALPAGATILAIHDEYVVLRHHGRMETLRMPEEDTSGAAEGPESFLPQRVQKNTRSRRTRSKNRRVRRKLSRPE